MKGDDVFMTKPILPPPSPPREHLEEAALRFLSALLGSPGISPPHSTRVFPNMCGCKDELNSGSHNTPRAATAPPPPPIRILLELVLTASRRWKRSHEKRIGSRHDSDRVRYGREAIAMTKRTSSRRSRKNNGTTKPHEAAEERARWQSRC